MINIKPHTDTNVISVGGPNIVPTKRINIRRHKLRRPKRRENFGEPVIDEENGLEDDDIALLANAKRMNTENSPLDGVNRSSESEESGDNVSEIDEDDATDSFPVPFANPTSSIPPHSQPTMGFGTTNGVDDLGTEDSESGESEDEDDLNAGLFNTGAGNGSEGSGSVTDDGSDGGSGSGTGSESGSDHSIVSSVRSTAPKYKDILEQKQELLYNLQKLEDQGYPPSRKYNMASNVDQMEAEVKRLKHQRDSRQSVKFQRKVLLAAVSGICFLNGRFDPIGAKLDGWDKNVAENVNDYDEIFLELYDKYQTSFKAEPEVRLLLTLGGSAFFYHIQQKLFNSSNISLESIFKDNPEIKRNLEAAALNAARNGAQTPFEHAAASNARAFMNQRHGNVPSATSSQSATQMRGPTGVDDILKSLESKTGDAPRGVNIGA